MCGLAGIIGGEWDLDAALDALAHRGPDARGIETEGEATHGHVRLAIRDPDPRSDQPFRYGQTLVSYVGELWNADLLREMLSELAMDFRTTGDTEVVAAVLDRWGAAGLQTLEGMFALAWTGPDGTFLARDRWGEIPLYFLPDSLLGFRWASERAAFGPDACYAEPVPAGSIVDRYADITKWYPQTPRARRVDADWVLGRLARAVEDRLVSDVPLCTLISGGLDSTLILSLIRETRPDVVAYTAVYDPASPDLAAARAVCSEWDVELREVEVPEPSSETLREAVSAIETPMKAQVEIALLTLPLAAQIARDGFRVVLSGEGADELFGGYGNLARKATSDESWRGVRLAAAKKMARGNFLRINKAFMRYGVEPRTPFFDRHLVEAILALGRDECPPGKRLLTRAASGSVPIGVLRRRKETFQGASGISAACQELTRDTAAKTYNDYAREAFGGLPSG